MLLVLSGGSSDATPGETSSTLALLILKYSVV